MTVRIVRSIAIAAVLLFPAQMAGAWELRGGLLRQDAFSFWASGENYEDAWAVTAELGFDPLFSVLGGEVAPMIGGTWAEGAALDSAHAGLTWTLRGDRAFLRLGLGGAVHNGDTDDPKDYARRRQLGSKLLFHVPAEIGFRLTPTTWASAYYVHVSNGQLADPNPGMDSIGVRFGWTF